MSSVLPPEFRASLRKAFRLSDSEKMREVIKLRDFIEENRERIPVDRIYEDAAQETGYRKSTLRGLVAQVSGYEDDRLMGWVKTLSFDHFEQAKTYRPEDPASLLDECIQIGGPDGKPMSADQMVQFALGEKPSRSPLYKFNQFWTKVPKLLSYLPPEKHDEFKAICVEFEQRIRPLFQKGS